MEAAGFVYSELLTKEMRSKAKADSARTDLVLDMKAKGKTSYSVGQHLWANMQVSDYRLFAVLKYQFVPTQYSTHCQIINIQVFINPLVASLPGKF